jgi:hypothetical protein
MRRRSWPFVVIALVAIVLAVVASHVMGAGTMSDWIRGMHGRR